MKEYTSSSKASAVHLFLKSLRYRDALKIYLTDKYKITFQENDNSNVLRDKFTKYL